MKRRSADTTKVELRPRRSNGKRRSIGFTELAHEILEIPAKSLAGIMVKLRLQDDPLDYDEGCAEILHSIDDDLRAMAGEPPRVEREDEDDEAEGDANV